MPFDSITAHNSELCSPQEGALCSPELTLEHEALITDEMTTVSVNEIVHSTAVIKLFTGKLSTDEESQLQQPLLPVSYPVPIARTSDSTSSTKWYSSAICPPESIMTAPSSLQADGKSAPLICNSASLAFAELNEQPCEDFLKEISDSVSPELANWLQIEGYSDPTSVCSPI